MSHSAIDADVRAWAEKHSLSISSGWSGRQVWNAYLSSVAGECFQIWIEPASDGKIGIHADYVEGPREPEPSREWTIDETGLQGALEQAYQQVVSWIAPSGRYLPER